MFEELATEFDPSDPIEWDDMSVGKFLTFGSFVSLFCDVFLYPLDLLKTRMQVQGMPRVSFSPYNSIIDGIKTIINQEGYKGFYKGFGVTIIGYMPMEFIYFTIYEYTKPRIKKAYKKLQAIGPSFLPNIKTAEPVLYFLCGAAAEVASGLIWIPCDVIQQKLMIQGPNHSGCKGGIETIKKVWRNDGLLGFYRGAYANFITFSIGGAIGWAVYEFSRRRLTRYTWDKHQNISNIQRSTIHAISGAVSGTIVAILTNPLDVVKTRLQVQDYFSKVIEEEELKPKYTNIRSMMVGIIKDEGWMALMRGTTARIFYSAPAAAASVCAYELVKRFALKSEVQNK